MLHLVLLICGSCETDVVQSISGASLLACPSSFPASSGTYNDCSISGKTSRAFYISSGTLTLRSCTFTSCTYSGERGGCIYSAGTSMYIYSCSFTSCKATGSYGGAIYCHTDNTLTLKDSTFDSCSADGGGCVCLYHTKESVIENCRVNSCTAANWGGVLELWECSYSLTVTDCTFVSCKETSTSNSWNGGGVIDVDDGTVNVNYCLIDSCTAANHGGGIHIYDVSSVVVFESEIRKCSAGSLGGGIACRTSSPSLTVSYVTITGCTAASSYGQAIHIEDCGSFKWDHLCITGSGTLVKSGTSISVPSAKELIAGCPPATPSRSATRSRSRSQSRSQSQSRSSTYCFTKKVQYTETRYPFWASSLIMCIYPGHLYH